MLMLVVDVVGWFSEVMSSAARSSSSEDTEDSSEKSESGDAEALPSLDGMASEAGLASTETRRSRPATAMASNWARRSRQEPHRQRRTN